MSIEEAQEALKNIDRIEAHCENAPDGTVFSKGGYWHANSVREALCDIKKRHVVGGVTRADTFLLHVISTSFWVN